MKHFKLYEEFLNEGAVKQFDKDVETLLEMGVQSIFILGSSLDEIPIWLREKVSKVDN